MLILSSEAGDQQACVLLSRNRTPCVCVCHYCVCLSICHGGWMREGASLTRFPVLRRPVSQRNALHQVDVAAVDHPLAARPAAALHKYDDFAAVEADPRMNFVMHAGAAACVLVKCFAV